MAQPINTSSRIIAQHHGVRNNHHMVISPWLPVTVSFVYVDYARVRPRLVKTGVFPPSGSIYTEYSEASVSFKKGVARTRIRLQLLFYVRT